MAKDRRPTAENNQYPPGMDNSDETSDDTYGWGDGTRVRGWGGSKRDFSVHRQDRSRLTRVSEVTDTYNYPGVDFNSYDEGDDD